MIDVLVILIAVIALCVAAGFIGFTLGARQQMLDDASTIADAKEKCNHAEVDAKNYKEFWSNECMNETKMSMQIDTLNKELLKYKSMHANELQHRLHLENILSVTPEPEQAVSNVNN